MHFLEYYCENILKQDLQNKFAYLNASKFPELKKIILNFGSKNRTMREISTILLSLELITTNRGTITVSKNPNVILKIQKGHPAGCKVILTKKVMYQFLEKLLIEILPEIKNFSGLKVKIQNNTFSFKLNSENIKLKELEEQYPLFSNLSDLNVNIKINTKTQKELIFFLKSLKLPIIFD